MKNSFNSPHIDHDEIMTKCCNKYNLSWKRVPPEYVSQTCPYHGSLEFNNIVLYGFIDFELELISFFHELGHFLLNKKSKLQKYNNYNTFMMPELDCWRIGFEIAYNEYDISFSDNAITWALNQVITYKNYHDNESQLLEPILDLTNKNETNEKISKYLKNINDNIILYINHISALESKKQNNKIKKIKNKSLEKLLILCNKELQNRLINLLQ
jgi:hypothetical protein